ncbi:MAG TPA: Gfo/Idh/MocA family oxidoreductase [Bdellovibrionota bacterium]|jgi:predicted dehydrogenase|nr:Gfo/Idh/MocA family oxidoreductase [Bdellovibrionota bacterium]
MAKALRLGLIGGGDDSFIGAIHRMAARLDGEYEICAGVLSSNPEKSKRSGEKIGLPSDRVYGSYQEMFAAEAKRADGIQAVSIVTPNHVHYGPAKLALESGIDVIIDKPLCLDLGEARELRELVQKTGLGFALTYTYAGYPAVIEAKDLVASGRLGKLRKVVVQYPQGWLGEKIEDQNQKQASWRTDPKRAGASCCFADIGSHAIQLAENISGQRVNQVLAELQTYVPGRSLDDDATVLLRFDGGMKGVALVSQISSGEGNALKIALYGDKGGLHWSHDNNNQLILQWTDRPREILEIGGDKAYLSEATRRFVRTPSGHPEGYIEAFANIYTSFARHVRARRAGEKQPYEFADVHDGFRGMAVVEAALTSSNEGSVWTKVADK